MHLTKEGEIHFNGTCSQSAFTYVHVCKMSECVHESDMHAIIIVSVCECAHVN